VERRGLKLVAGRPPPHGRGPCETAHRRGRKYDQEKAHSKWHES
jgi:hypothetical protein